MPEYSLGALAKRLERVLANPSCGMVFRGGRWRLNALGELRAEFLAQSAFQQEIWRRLRAAEREDLLISGARTRAEARERLAESRKHSYHRRRARLAANGVSDLSRDEWDSIKRAWDWRCAYCGAQPERLTLDHLLPVARGGAHTASNVVPACKSCNSSKGARRPTGFAVQPDATLLPALPILPPQDAFEEVY